MPGISGNSSSASAFVSVSASRSSATFRIPSCLAAGSARACRPRWRSYIPRPAPGAGVLILLPASQVLIDHVGWRGAYQIFGGAALLLLLPLLALPWRLFSTGSPHLAGSATAAADEGWTFVGGVGHH